MSKTKFINIFDLEWEWSTQYIQTIDFDTFKTDIDHYVSIGKVSEKPTTADIKKLWDQLGGKKVEKKGQNDGNI
jgi:hypothetical protein